MHGLETHARQCQEGLPSTSPIPTSLKALDLVRCDNLGAQETRELQTRHQVNVTLLAHLREKSKPNNVFVLGTKKKNLVSMLGLVIRI